MGTDCKSALSGCTRGFSQTDEVNPRYRGVKNGKNVFAPPISVAVFDYYYGAQIQLEMETQKNNDFFSVLGIADVKYINAEIELKMSLAKSIFKKVSPELYSRCF